MVFEYNDKIATADVCIDVSADSKEKLFEDFAIATEKVMIENLEILNGNIKKEVLLEGKNLEDLLFKFLNELIFLKDAEGLVFNKFQFRFKNVLNKKHLIVEMFGEKINSSKHVFGVDVKAVTKHLFLIKNEGNIWKGRVILDI